MMHSALSCEPYALCSHSPCFDTFCDSLGQNCSVVHTYPSKMSCHDNTTNSYGICNTVGRCQIDSNYSCPNSCEQNIIAGCHNYTLNTTHPCNNENLCNYYITLMNCRDEEICAPQNPLRNINMRKHLTVNLQLCSETKYAPSLSHLIFSDSTSSCITRDLDLTENKATLLTTDFYDEYVLVEYSPGVPADGYRLFNNVSEYSGNDGQERTCFAFWSKQTSRPYCSYSCFPVPNHEHSVVYDGSCNGNDCAYEYRSVRIMQIIPNITVSSSGNFSSPHGNSTDNTSDGYVLAYKWNNFLMLIMLIMASVFLAIVN